MFRQNSLQLGDEAYSIILDTGEQMRRSKNGREILEMKIRKKIRIIVADPAGNITIFVKDPFDRTQYQQVAKQLLENEDLKGEQVAFILDTPQCGRAEGKMEMCGLEFCGNGSRSFGLIRARDMGIKGKGSVNVDVSGCDEILTVEVDTDTNYTKVKMPCPVGMSKIDLCALQIDDGDNTESNKSNIKETPLVDFGGILHVILRGIPATKENFDAVKDYITEKFNPPALGVMFCDSKTERDGESLIFPITPVVYVKDVDTTYFEGSCGSGTTACAAAFGLEKGEGIHHFVFPQPAGTIEATAVIARGGAEKGYVEKVYIEGKVELSEEKLVEIEVES